MNADGSNLVRLTNTAAGADEGSPSWQALPLTLPNPIDDAQFFVRQHYLDFLDREPEPAGFNDWVNTLNACPAGDTACDRVRVSSAFFRSDEFHLKGYYVFRFYKAAFGTLPFYEQVMPDMRAVTAPSTQEVRQKKAAYAAGFVQRAEFQALYGSLSNEAYVSALLGRYNLQSITTIDPQNPDAGSQITLTAAELTSQLNAGTLDRAKVLRAVVDSTAVSQAEFNSGFVAMQYYGYLRRTPESGGYSDWLRTIEANPADIRSMVNGFVNSTEYRRRFGQP
ncbi:MAG: DUF4214 domain-containing protein [Acidobacteria bacterium]|nr:DUF4214 domain-containing protein [Acidobacteriota bacterium]